MITPPPPSLETYLPALLRFRDNYLHPGGFLMWVLMNDLRGAAADVDKDARHLLYDLAKWCENNLPVEAWGNGKNFYAWLNRRYLAPEKNGDGSGA